MPNYCDYEMKIKGQKENVKCFLNKLKDYNEDNHFWRIFELEVVKEGKSKGLAYSIVSGYCAWSIETCCRASGYSDGVDLLAVNTKDLNLDVEIWSRENEGCFFEEHYIYKNGECIVAETESIESEPPYWEKDYYPTFEEYLDNCVDESLWDKIKESDFDEDGEFIGEIETGGFKNWGKYKI